MTRAPGGLDGLMREAFRAPIVVGDHPDDDMWVAFAGDRLPADTRAAMANHVVTCDTCAEVFRALATLREEARAGGPVPGPAVVVASSLRPFRAVVWIPLAAAAVLVLALVVPRAGDSTTTPSAAPAPVAPSTGASEPVPPRAWARAVEAPPVVLPARYALVVRGDTPNAFVLAFGQAITPYREGRYADAAAQLASVVAAYPDVTEAAFYLGVSQLLGGDPAAARPSLAVAEQAESLGRAARWFGAVAAERVGDAVAADAALRALCASPGAYQTDACAVAPLP